MTKPRNRNREPETFVLDGAYFRTQAKEAAATFFRPIIGALSGVAAFAPTNETESNKHERLRTRYEIANKGRQRKR